MNIVQFRGRTGPFLKPAPGGANFQAEPGLRELLGGAPVRTMCSVTLQVSLPGAGRRPLLASVKRLGAPEGHEAQVAFDGETALRLTDGFQPDVLLLDIGLPGIDGRELARRFRAREDTRDALIVAVSGYGNRHDIEASAEAGFDLHLVKPVDPRAIEAMMARELATGRHHHH